MASERDDKLQAFLQVLGHNEEPFGMVYTDREPDAGYAPAPGRLPSIEEEAQGEVKRWSRASATFRPRS